eukprot:gene8373-biopygen10641
MFPERCAFLKFPGFRVSDDHVRVCMCMCTCGSMCMYHVCVHHVCTGTTTCTVTCSAGTLLSAMLVLSAHGIYELVPASSVVSTPVSGVKPP